MMFNFQTQDMSKNTGAKEINPKSSIEGKTIFFQGAVSEKPMSLKELTEKIKQTNK